MPYTETTLKILSYQLKNRSWKRDDALGSICLIHGIGEHSKRYDHWAERFNNAGYSFFSLDLPGHGESSGKRGHIDKFDTYLDIIENLLQSAAADHPDLPLILYGHSMGGLIAFRYLLSERSKPAMAVLSSPWLGLVVKPASILIGIAKLVQRIYPAFLQKTELEQKYISHDLNEVEKYKNDPLIHDKISVNTFVGMQKAIDYVFNHIDQLVTPAIVLHGSDDMITAHDASQKVVSMTEKAEFVSMPGLYHEMHNEENKDEFFDIIINWIRKS